jgi:organic radical activating enzyme
MLSKEIQLEVNRGHASIEEFYTIKGRFSYRNSSVFVRIGGCDVGCHGC